MAHATYTTGEAPTIIVRRCMGDLEIGGHAELVLTLVSGTIPENADRSEGFVIEECEDDLRLLVPHGASVSVDHIDGDARIERIAACTLGRVDGDLILEAIGGPCSVHAIGGDVRGRDLAALTLGTVGGDARLDEVRGALALEHVGGDAALRGTLAGLEPVQVGGDLTLDTSFAPGGSYRATVRGDATVFVPDDADLTLEATVDGDVTGLETSGRHRPISAVVGDHHSEVSWHASVGHDGEVITRVWGDGQAHLALDVDGDLRIRRTAARGAHADDRPAGGRAPSPGAQEAAITQQAAIDRREVVQDTPRPTADDPTLSILQAVARGEISPGEADDLLSHQ
jgi:hypothetical protein